MSENIMDRIDTIIDKYEPQLTQKGIGCKVSKKYFEVKTDPAYATGNLLSKISRFFAKKRENKLFKHQNNRYQCVVLCFYPIEKDGLKANACKEYSFMLKKTERIEEGYTPKSKVNNEAKILNKIERLFVKIMKESEKYSTKKICAEKWYDIFRYLFKVEYGYKKRIFNKERNFWDLLFSSIIIAVIAVVCTMIYIL